MFSGVLYNLNGIGASMNLFPLHYKAVTFTPAFFTWMYLMSYSSSSSNWIHILTHFIRIFQNRCFSQRSTDYATIRKYYNFESTWRHGHRLCKKENGNLAILKSPKDVALVNFIKTINYKHPFSFIGLQTNLSAIYMYR